MEYTYKPIALKMDISEVREPFSFVCPVCGADYSLGNSKPNCDHLILSGLDEDDYYIAKSLQQRRKQFGYNYELVDALINEGVNEPMMIYSFHAQGLSEMAMYYIFSFKDWEDGGIGLVSMFS